MFNSNRGSKISKGLKEIVFISAFYSLLFCSWASADDSLSDKSSCEISHEQIQSVQFKIFEMKEPGGEETYLNLLKERDVLNSKKVMIETLISLWDKYNNYLRANHNFAGMSQNARNSVQGLLDLRSLIANNEQSVQKYQLVSDVFSSIDPEEVKGNNAEENFNLLKNKLMNNCQAGQSHLMYCEIARKASEDGIDIWSNIQAGSPPPSNASGREVMLHKFIEVSSTALGNENFGWFRNLSSMFVDNEELRYDLVGNGDLSQSVLATIDQITATCREQALLTESRVNCMSQDLTEIAPQGSSFDYVSHIQSHLGSQVRTPQDLMDKYLENVNRISHAHEEIAGGTIDKFANLAEQRNLIVSNLAAADGLLSQSAHASKENLRNQAAIEAVKMGSHFSTLKKSDRLYRTYKNSETSSRSIAQMANDELKDILNHFSDGDSSLNDMFFNASTGNDNGETTLGIHPEKLEAFFRNNTLTKEKLNSLLKNGFSGNRSLDDEIAAIDRRLESFNQNPEFELLEGIKSFAWKQAMENCKGDSQFNIREIDNSQCITDENFSPVDNLLEMGNQLVGYQNNQQEELNLNTLYDNCQSLREDQLELYSSQYAKVCNEIRVKRREVARAEEYYSDRARRERFRNNRRYDSDGENVVAQYRSKSWAELLPGAIQHAMPAGMRLGQTWANTYGIKSQMLGYTTYAKQRYRYLEQQYNQGVSICNTTMSCYFNSQYQAFLPTYGGGVNSFGTGAFSSNTTTFFAQ